MESPKKQRAQGHLLPSVQIEGVERFAGGSQVGFLPGADGVAGQQAVAGCHGPIVPSFDLD